MPDMLLTFHCATCDRDLIAEALRALTREPLHLREEAVLGRDFGDARAGEQVRGALRRAAIELVVEDGAVAALVEAVRDSRRAQPVRWRSLPIADRGRIA
jgi:hypothetical protein